MLTLGPGCSVSRPVDQFALGPFHYTVLDKAVVVGVADAGGVGAGKAPVGRCCLATVALIGPLC